MSDATSEAFHRASTVAFANRMLQSAVGKVKSQNGGGGVIGGVVVDGVVVVMVVVVLVLDTSPGHSNECGKKRTDPTKPNTNSFDKNSKDGSTASERNLIDTPTEPPGHVVTMEITCSVNWFRAKACCREFTSEEFQRASAV